MQVGSLKGAAEDKFERFSIKGKPREYTGQALIPDEAAAWMECEVESTSDIKGVPSFHRAGGSIRTIRVDHLWSGTRDGFFSLNKV